MAGLWYFKQDIFIPPCRREWFPSIGYGKRLRDPAGAVRLTGPSPGQPAVHPLSRLDRPAVTHSAVKPWAGGFEMWQHNQFPWFMITPKGGLAERLGSWRRRAGEECWQQQSADEYSSGAVCFWLCFSCLLDLPQYITFMWGFIEPDGKILLSLNDLQSEVRAQGQPQHRAAPCS